MPGLYAQRGNQHGKRTFVEDPMCKRLFEEEESPILEEIALGIAMKKTRG